MALAASSVAIPVSRARLQFPRRRTPRDRRRRRSGRPGREGTL